MRRLLLAALAALTVFALAGPAYAGNPHFVDDQSFATVDGDTLTATFKEAGLGDEPQR